MDVTYSDNLMYSDYMYQVGSFGRQRLKDLVIPDYQKKKFVNVKLVISTEILAGE